MSTGTNNAWRWKLGAPSSWRCRGEKYFAAVGTDRVAIQKVARVQPNYGFRVTAARQRVVAVGRGKGPGFGYGFKNIRKKRSFGIHPFGLELPVA